MKTFQMKNQIIENILVLENQKYPLLSSYQFSMLVLLEILDEWKRYYN